MAQSKFGLRMLKNQGWKEGDGLGKNLDGNSKPIKAFIKQDKAGLGQDIGADLTDHWWLRVFNDAAKNNVTQTNKKSEGKNKATPKNKNKLYAGFIKGSVLNRGEEEKDSDCDSSESEGEHNVSSSSVPTLDDIYKYCGGATGHRAATLGIKMSGKLQRAAEHERMFDKRIKNKIGATTTDNDKLNSDTDIPETKMKRKKKKKRDVEKADNLPETTESTVLSKSEKDMDRLFNEGEDCDKNDESLTIEKADKVKSKKSKKSKRQREENGQDGGNELSVTSLEDTDSVKKKKKDSTVEENIESADFDHSHKSKLKKKKKKHRE